MIGAGFAGAWVALHLVQRGASVALLEAGPGPPGESVRNAGVLVPFAGENAFRLEKALGRPGGRELGAYALRAYRELRAPLESPTAEEGIWWLAWRGEEARELEASVPLLENLGHAVEFAGAAEVARRTGATGAAAGLHLAEATGVDPAALLATTLSRARALGATVTSGGRVVALADEVLETTAGRLEAEIVVVAAGFRSAEFAPSLADAIHPVRGQMLATRPVPRAFETMFSANWRFDSWRQTPEGRLLAGGMRWSQPEMECGLTEEVVNEDLHRRLADFLPRRFPSLPPLEVESAWSGIMAHSADLLPIAGPLPGHPRRWIAAGFSGDGLVLSYAIGRDLAAWIAGEKPEAPWPLFSPRRFLR